MNLLINLKSQKTQPGIMMSPDVTEKEVPMNTAYECLMSSYQNLTNLTLNKPPYVTKLILWGCKQQNLEYVKLYRTKIWFFFNI